MKIYMLIMFIKLRDLADLSFSKIEGNENTIMGIPVEKIKDYLSNYEK